MKTARYLEGDGLFVLREGKILIEYEENFGIILLPIHHLLPEILHIWLKPENDLF